MDTLDYALFPNHVTPDPNDCTAVIQNQNIVDMDQIEREMTEEGTGLTLPQTKAYNEKFFQLVERHAARGERVALPLFIVRSIMKGVFRDKDDSYDSSRHSVVFNITPGPRLRKLEKTVKPVKVKAATPMPDPQDIIDGATGERNRTITPGGIATLKGYNLKFDKADPAQGLFFVPVDNAAAAVRVEQFTAIKPSELHFLVPQLTPGEYRVEVKVVMHKVKDVRSGTLMEIIETN